MLKRKFVLSILMLVTLVIGTVGFVFATDRHGKKEFKFKVVIENITDKTGVATKYGVNNMFGLSPGVYTLSKKNTSLFKEGGKASPAIEAMAEDGQIDLFKGVVGSFLPVGSDKWAPLFAGGTFEFEFTATKGNELNLVTMYGPSNDLFYAPRHAIGLFDAKGNPITGDITDKFVLWDAGTEVNQEPGKGSDQAPFQKAQNTGADEHGVVHLVNDGFTYPETKTVLRVTITIQ